MKQLPKKIVPFICHFLMEDKWQFLLMVVSKITGLFLENIAIPYSFKVLLDKIISFTGDKSRAWEILGSPLFLLATIWLWVEILFRMFDFIKIRTIPTLEGKIRVHAIQHLQQHAYQFFVERFTGDLAHKVNDLAVGISTTLILLIKHFLPAVITLAIGVISFFIVHPSFGFLLGCWVFLHIGMHFHYAKQCHHYTTAHAEASSQLSGKVADIFSNMLSSKLFPNNNYELKYFESQQNIEQYEHKKSLSAMMKVHSITSVLCVVFMGVSMPLYMVYNWKKGNINAAEVTYIFTASWNIVTMVWETVGQLPDFFEELGIFQQAFKVIEVQHTIVDIPGAKRLICTKGAIKFENVSFKYEKETILFHNQNIEIRPGEKIGLVGYSGSGKSSFVHLILRFFELDEGTISIDGQDISKIMQHSLREHITLIPQNTTLFHRSIMENIRYGRSNATDEEVIIAAKAAGCHQFITKLQKKYETLVGERGAKISGGQRQMISIARAFLKQTPILILDETTSALDSVTAYSMQKSLKKLMEHKTTIVIAHRLSTLCDMDRILVFDQGKILEEGSHAQLMQEKGHYVQMWKMQSNNLCQ